MKNKLRQITIENTKYLYTITDKYLSETKNNIITIRVFLVGHKQTPLVIYFLTWDDFYTGQPLKSGFSLTNKITNSIDRININEPKYIREFILQGQKNGWTGINEIESQDGITYLNKLGYDTTSLQPNT